MTESEKLAWEAAAEAKFNDLYWSSLSGDLHEVAKMKFVFGDGFKAGVDWRDARHVMSPPIAPFKSLNDEIKEWKRGPQFEAVVTSTEIGSSIYRDASQYKASAEFPSEELDKIAFEFAMRSPALKTDAHRSIAWQSFYQGSQKGFAKGRESCDWTMQSNSSMIAKIKDLEAKLAEANAEIERHGARND